jgi:vacuolar-type H+-ATPase subunit I/STV1
LSFDWSDIKKEDLSPIHISDLFVPINENDVITYNGLVACDHKSDYSDICTASYKSCSDYESEIDKLKLQLKEAEEANDSMRTDNKAMVDSIIMHENRIKELDAENSRLKEKIEELVEAIEYCKKNGIWADKPVMMPLLRVVCPCLAESDDECNESEHLFDGLEMNDEDKN